VAPVSALLYANFFTDYKFASGMLKNIRVGGGVQAIGPKVIGNRGGDTIRNPANSNAAIDDRVSTLTR